MAQPLGRGEVLAVARRGSAFSSEEQALFGYLARQAAVAMENVALHEQLRREATIDELTGLSNHRRFQEALAHEMVRMRRSGRPTALALIDVDDFKTINDTHGHQHGDRVLQTVARLLSDACRATDEPARYGGDELAVILSETDLEGALVIGESLRRAVAAHEGGLTISVGVSAVRPDAGSADALIHAADAALYEAKRGGKNRTCSGGWAAGAAAPHGEDARAGRFARHVRPRL
jgi:diguanylate cyclase (GGDEF)-like protein